LIKRSFKGIFCFDYGGSLDRSIKNLWLRLGCYGGNKKLDCQNLFSLNQTQSEIWSWL